jgi:hypothetical protein
MMMSRMYDMNDLKDINALNRILNMHGIHFERNMFDQPYVILDRPIYKVMKSLEQGSPKKRFKSKKKDKQIS